MSARHRGYRADFNLHRHVYVACPLRGSYIHDCAILRVLVIIDVRRIRLLLRAKARRQHYVQRPECSVGTPRSCIDPVISTCGLCACDTAKKSVFHAFVQRTPAPVGLPTPFLAKRSAPRRTQLLSSCLGMSLSGRPSYSIQTQKGWLIITIQTNVDSADDM